MVAWLVDWGLVVGIFGNKWTRLLVKFTRCRVHQHSIVFCSLWIALKMQKRNVWVDFILLQYLPSLCCDVSIYRWIYRIFRKKHQSFHLVIFVLGFYFFFKVRIDMLETFWKLFSLSLIWAPTGMPISQITHLILVIYILISKPSTHTCKVTGRIEFEYFFLKVKEDICQRNFYIFSFFDLGQIFRF